MRRFLQDENGQAIVEYLLMLSVAMTFVGIIVPGMKKLLRPLWTFYIRSITAACPSGCQSDYRL